MDALYVPALVIAFLVTLLELTEVVALVFALGSDRASVRPGVYGALAGATLVAGIALGFGAVLERFPTSYLLWAATIVLAAFGVFLFRSTVRSYRRAASPPTPGSSVRRDVVQFGGGFSVGAVEVTEAVVVLLALTAGGYGVSALVGAAVAAVVLVAVASVVHDQIRKIKVPWLKWFGTALVFSLSLIHISEPTRP